MSFLTPLLAPIFEGITTAGVVKGGLAAASAGAGIIGAVGSISAGRSSAGAAEYNAAVNRQLAERARAEGDLEARQFAKDERRKLAVARTGRLASGVTMAGSPMMVDEDMINEIAFNEALIRSGGEVRATRAGQAAELQTARARSARTASYYRAGASALGTARDLTFIYSS